ncbi:MAG: rhomboid family intramembrane serine protease [Saprospiraceae bacterium]|nr:rhomboid family intramembrane serine protease [Saprospiraceae bacterium]
MSSISLTIVIVILTVLVSYRAFNDQQLFYRLAHWPIREHHKKEYYRMVTSGFVHGDWIHLLINMFVFWNFGEIVEQYFYSFFGPIMGGILFVLVYLGIIVLASLGTFYKKRDKESYVAVGASGGVSGIVFIFILFYPWEPLYLYGIIPIPGIIAGILYLWYSSYAGKHMKGKIDHDAHFYGAVLGVVLMILLKPSVLKMFINKLIADFPL